MGTARFKAYEDAWVRLRNKVLEEKTSWGKEDLKKRMDKLLIEVLEEYLNKEE